MDSRKEGGRRRENMLYLAKSVSLKNFLFFSPLLVLLCIFNFYVTDNSKFQK